MPAVAPSPQLRGSPRRGAGRPRWGRAGTGDLRVAPSAPWVSEGMLPFRLRGCGSIRAVPGTLGTRWMGV